MKPIQHRAGENGLLPFRTERVFNKGNDWFFAVRGGEDCGPFQDQQEAISGLQQFLRQLNPPQIH